MCPLLVLPDASIPPEGVDEEHEAQAADLQEGPVLQHGPGPGGHRVPVHLGLPLSQILEVEGPAGVEPDHSLLPRDLGAVALRTKVHVDDLVLCAPADAHLGAGEVEGSALTDEASQGAPRARPAREDGHGRPLQAPDRGDLERGLRPPPPPGLRVRGNPRLSSQDVLLDVRSARQLVAVVLRQTPRRPLKLLAARPRRPHPLRRPELSRPLSKLFCDHPKLLLV
mmetsp:Transcript_1375/g.4834  ORF Transcript_1375/g.4834 Transcript_1375/m.4834 type:complete len:225 (-) Transcript_1375:156-830(-)